MPLPTLDVIFTYAPALFRSDAVRRVAGLLRDAPKLPQKLGRDLAGELDACRAAMQAALRLWDRCSDDPAGMAEHPTDGPQSVLDVWSKLGLLDGGVPSGRGHRCFAASLTGAFEGVCLLCGSRQAGPKLAMLSSFDCGGCRKPVEFVVVSSAR